VVQLAGQGGGGDGAVADAVLYRQCVKVCL
jgi:hypothetical protein